MKNRKILLVLILFSWLLPVAQTFSTEKMDFDLGKMDASRALNDAYSFMAQPYSLLCFHNMDKLGLDLDWIRRAGPVIPLKDPKKGFTVEYTFHGERRTLNDYLKRSFALGFLVLNDDHIVFEKYFHHAGPKSRFLSNSVVKSIVSVLIGIAIEEGKIRHIEDPAVQYLPCLADSGFKHVTVKNLLQMASGIRWNEDYPDPDADFNRYMVAQLRGEPSFMELAASCEAMAQPGAHFEYQSINTQVLGQLLEAATGMPLNRYCQEKLWSKIGADSDAFFYRAKLQTQIPAAVGFDATLRDYGRFGLMVMNGGTLGGCRVVSKDWIRESTTLKGASELPQPAGPNDEFSENLGYAYQWWLLDGQDGVFMAMGIYGQAIYINPARHVVIVQTSAWPEPDPEPYWDEMVKVMTTIAEKTSPSISYTQQLWENNYPFYQKIRNLPFNQELLSGKLDEQVFRNYIIQDYLYLQNYRKVYGILLSKAPDETMMKFILKLINGIDEEIESIHGAYIQKFEISREELLHARTYPNTEFYNAFLIKTATLEPFEVGLIATLPCHWIYFQLGMDMKNSRKAQGSKYQEWINGYAEDAWEVSETKEVVNIVETCMRKTTAEIRGKMKQAFDTAMKLEYMFWDGIYKDLIWIE